MPAQNKVFDSLRRDWYGPDRAPAEISANHVQLRPVGDLLDKALSRIMPRQILLLNRLRDRWTEVVGEDSGRRCNPLFVKDEVLHIEVSHAVYRMALDTPQMKEAILHKISLLCGDKFCKSIRFIPCGRSAAAAFARKKKETK